MKYDDMKLRFDLVPFEAIEQLAAVLTFGALKYEPESWQEVPDAINRYRAALLRHYSAYVQGEDYDPDSGLHHVAHMMACIAFITTLEKKAGNIPDTKIVMEDFDWKNLREHYKKERENA